MGQTSETRLCTRELLFQNRGSMSLLAYSLQSPLITPAKNTFCFARGSLGSFFFQNRTMSCTIGSTIELHVHSILKELVYRRDVRTWDIFDGNAIKYPGIAKMFKSKLQQHIEMKCQLRFSYAGHAKSKLFRKQKYALRKCHDNFLVFFGCPCCFLYFTQNKA